MLWGACKHVFSGIAPFWTPVYPILAPWPLLGHVAFKRSLGGKIFTSRVLAPHNPFQFILNVFGSKIECFGVPVSMCLVEAHHFGPHITPFWPPLALVGSHRLKRSPGSKILTSRVLGPPNPFQCILNVFGTKIECFGVPVSMFSVGAHPFGPHLAPFCPPGICWDTSPLNGPGEVHFYQVGSWGLPTLSIASKLFLGQKIIALRCL